MFRIDKIIGQCVIDTGDGDLMIGGGYEILNAWLISDEQSDVNNSISISDNEIEEHNFWQANSKPSHTIFYVNDKSLISKITGHSFEQLMATLGIS